MQRLAILLASGLVLLALSTPSRAHDPLGAPPGPDAALWNARACIGEVGWRAPLEACSAMVWVHVKRARQANRTIVDMTRAYSRAVRRPPRHRAWVPQLHTAATPPVAWPPHLDEVWFRSRDRFELVLEHVRAILRGHVPDPCPAVLHYGGPMDSTPSQHVEDEACRFEGTRQRFFRRDVASGA